MTRVLSIAMLLLTLSACREYESYPRLSSQKGLVPADKYATYGREQAEEVAIGREFGRAHAGDALDDRVKQADAAVAYAKTLPDVATVEADPQGYRLTVSFKSGWRVAVLPIDDGRRGGETAGLPAGAGGPPPSGK